MSGHQLTQIIMCIAAVLIAIGRFLIPGHDLSLSGTYEAFAHIWVGAIGTFWLQNARWVWLGGIFPVWIDPYGYAILLLGLTTLETVMFMLR